MKRYELGSLLFKCCGIYLILLAIENGASVLFTVILSLGRGIHWELAGTLVVGLLLLGAGLLAIRWSDSLGRKIYPRLPDEPATGHLTLDELAPLVFAGIGVVFIVIAVSMIARYLLSLTILLTNSYPGESSYRVQLISYLGALFKYLCEGFLGAWLLLRAQPLAEWWTRLREFPEFVAGSEDEEEEEKAESDSGEGEDPSRPG